MLTYGQARPDEENDLIDFANYVFSYSGAPTDFKKLHPWVYGRPGFSAITQVAREDGRIRGMISAVHDVLSLNGQELKFGYIGTVSTHPYARGQGIMRQLMSRTLDNLKAQGCQLVVLGGRRQRYQYYGFEDAGTRVTLNLTGDSLRHTLGDRHHGHTFAPLDQAGEDAMLAARTLYSRGSYICLRSAQAFETKLHTWDGQAWAVFRDGGMAGYFYMVNGQVAEFFFEEDVRLPDVFQDFMAFNKLNQLRVELSVTQMERCSGLFAAASSFSQHPACMLRVTDWQAFLQVFLRYKACHQPLTPGRRVLDIAHETRLSIVCEGTQVCVQACANRADMSLDAQAAVRLTTLQLSRALYPDHPFLDWFPVDFYLPQADSF